MKTTAIRSDAFPPAALRSERLRVLGLVIVLVLLGLAVVVVGLTTQSRPETRLVPYPMTLVAVFGAYELPLLAWVPRAMRAQRDVTAWSWRLNLVVQTPGPTVALLILTASEFFGP